MYVLALWRVSSIVVEAGSSLPLAEEVSIIVVGRPQAPRLH